MKIAETSRRKIGYKNTFIYFCICECENCKTRFNINKKFFDHAIKFNKPLPGRFCSVSCKKRYYKKKKCNVEQKCAVKKITSTLENELQVAILRKAALFEREDIKRNRKERPALK